jgi:hypothetical protein
MAVQYRPDAIASRLRRWQATISSWTGTGMPSRAAPRSLPAAAEPLRQAMRELAGELGPACTPRLAYAIGASRDVASLWHLRGPLMQALAAARGERAAREQIACLDALFLRAWPRAPLRRA